MSTGASAEANWIEATQPTAVSNETSLDVT